MPVPGFIKIRFIKPVSAAVDDTIDIRPAGVNQVAVTMTGCTATDKVAVHAALNMSHDNCLRWLLRTSRLLSTDDFPIKHVQFDFPLCPSVIYKLEHLDRHNHVIYDMLAFQLSVWAVRPPPISIPPPPPLEEIFVDDDDELNTAFIAEEGAAAGRHANQVKGSHHLFFE